jgi:hypothetical protein
MTSPAEMVGAAYERPHIGEARGLPPKESVGCTRDLVEWGYVITTKDHEDRRRNVHRVVLDDPDSCVDSPSTADNLPQIVRQTADNPVTEKRYPMVEIVRLRTDKPQNSPSPSGR